MTGQAGLASRAIVRTLTVLPAIAESGRLAHLSKAPASRVAACQGPASGTVFVTRASGTAIPAVACPARAVVLDLSGLNRCAVSSSSWKSGGGSTLKRLRCQPRPVNCRFSAHCGAPSTWRSANRVLVLAAAPTDIGSPALGILRESLAIHLLSVTLEAEPA